MFLVKLIYHLIILKSKRYDKRNLIIKSHMGRCNSLIVQHIFAHFVGIFIDFNRRCVLYSIDNTGANAATQFNKTECCQRE